MRTRFAVVDEADHVEPVEQAVAGKDHEPPQQRSADAAALVWALDRYRELRGSRPAGADRLELADPAHLAALDAAHDQRAAPVELFAIGGDLCGAGVAAKAQQTVVAIQPQQIVSHLAASNHHSRRIAPPVFALGVLSPALPARRQALSVRSAPRIRGKNLHIYPRIGMSRRRAGHACIAGLRYMRWWAALPEAILAAASAGAGPVKSSRVRMPAHASRGGSTGPRLRRGMWRSEPR
jgi:hypothetical protein